MSGNSVSGILFAIFIVLHGLVHFWYVALAQKLVPFKPEMGWTGRSWLLTKAIGDPLTRFLASLFYSLAAIGIVVSAAGMSADNGWWAPVLTISLVLSSLALAIFWDGKLEKIVEKGLIGLVINVILLLIMAVR